MGHCTSCREDLTNGLHFLQSIHSSIVELRLIHSNRKRYPECSFTGFVGIRLSDHARDAMARRGLSDIDVLAVARDPEQVIDIRPGRVLAQAIRRLRGEHKVYLLRVVIDIWPDGPEVVTAYKTSQIARYWKGVQ